jgi:hypothetical protein
MFLTTQTGGNGLRWGLTGVAEYALGNFTWAANTWYYIAAKRTSGAVTLWVDGNNITTGTPTNSTTFTGAFKLFGGVAGAVDFTGLVDDFRITNGVARTITVPTAAFPDVGPMGVPTSLTASAGNAQASLSWTAPTYNGGSAITDYSVQYSTNSGSTWSNFSHTASTATTSTVTGLTNGTAYVFRVAAVNGNGTGDYTSATSSVTPGTAPVSKIGVRNDIATTGTFVSGLGTFGGSGTLSDPFVRAAKTTVNAADGLAHYRFQANATGTVYVTFKFIDDDVNSNAGYVSKNGTIQGDYVGNGSTVTRSISVIAGDYITLDSTDINYTSIEGVSIYAV